MREGGRERDISCFAWDTGPNRRCSAWGKSIHRLYTLASTVLFIRREAKRISMTMMSEAFMSLFNNCIEQHSLRVEAVDV